MAAMALDKIVRSIAIGRLSFVFLSQVWYAFLGN